MARVIPWPSGAAWRQELTIDRRVYKLRARWNTSREYWSLDILTRNEEPLVLGRKLVLGWPVTFRDQDERLPRGQLIPVDPSGSLERIHRNDLGDRVQLLFIPEAEL